MPTRVGNMPAGLESFWEIMVRLNTKELCELKLIFGFFSLSNAIAILEAGLIHDSGRGGLNNEASVSLRLPVSFIFHRRFANKFATPLKNKSPDAAHRGFVVAGAGLVV